MAQEEVHIPDQQTGVDPDDPLQTIASDLYSIDRLTITPAYIATPLQSPVEGFNRILVFGGGHFAVLHILDTSRDCTGCPRTVNSINRPTDTEAISIAQQLRKYHSESPENVPEDRYIETLGAVRQLLIQDRVKTEAALDPLISGMARLGNELQTVYSFIDEVGPESE